MTTSTITTAHRLRIALVVGSALLLAAPGCGDAGARNGFAPGLGGSAGGKQDDPDAGGSDDGGSDGESDGDDEPIMDPDDDLSEYVLALGHLVVDDWAPKAEGECETLDCPVDGQEGEEFCAYVHYGEKVHASEFVAFQPNSATLWPGNVLRGDDAQHGILTPIGLPRAPMTWSVSLENLDGSPVGHMEEPKLSAFRDERNRILDQGTTGAVPAQITYDILDVHSESQVAVSVGGSLNWFSGGLSSMFDFTNKQESTKILVDFTQAYYTIDVDTPGLPSDFFKDDVTVEDLENFAGPGDPPMYVQSITYGRRVLFAVESSYSEQDVRFAFDASYNALLVGGGVQIETHHLDVLSQSHISALVLGGSGGDAVKTVSGFGGLLEYLQDGAEYSKDSPGAAIAYKLAYLDNTGVKLAFATDYAERQCYDNFVDVTGEVAKLEYLGGNDNGGAEVFGHLEFRAAAAGDPDPCNPNAGDWQVLFDRNDDGAQDVYGLWVPTSPIKRSVYDLEVPPAGAQPQLCMKGHLREADNCWLFCSDDDFGHASLGPIPLDAGWAGDYELEFSDEGTVIATLRFSVD